jgi:hypothetical protein
VRDLIAVTYQGLTKEKVGHISRSFLKIFWICGTRSLHTERIQRQGWASRRNYATADALGRRGGIGDNTEQT